MSVEVVEIYVDKNERMDELELALLGNFDTVDCPLIHKFVPGMYIREIFMPKDAVVTSLIHKTTHPFFILQGKVSVFSENDGTQQLEAPYSGITTPGTRRVLKIHENTIWVTCHVTDIHPTDDSEEAVKDAVDKITDEIIEKHINPFLGGVVRNNILSVEQELLAQ